MSNEEVKGEGQYQEITKVTMREWIKRDDETEEEFMERYQKEHANRTIRNRRIRNVEIKDE